MPTRLLLVLCLAALALPARAAAQSTPFGPGPADTPVQTTPQTVAVPSAAADDDDGLRGWQQVLIFLGGGALLLGIGLAIVRDARRRAPVADAPGRALARAAREEEHRRRKAKARASAKRARAARKRNRPR